MWKRVLWLVAVVACKGPSKDKAPPPPPVTPPVPGDAMAAESPRPTMRSSPRIDLMTEESLKITEVQIVPLGFASGTGAKPEFETGVFQVSATVQGSGSIRLQTQCRVANKNLVFLGSDADATPIQSEKLSVMFRPDPYKEKPSLCEITFFHSLDPKGEGSIVAQACFHEPALDSGRCPRGFPAPTLPDGFALDFEPHKRVLNNGALQVRGVITLGVPVASDQKRRVSARCETESKKVIKGSDEMAFFDLRRIPGGGSAEGLFLVSLPEKIAEDARCELDFETLPPKGNAFKRGTFCLTGAGDAASASPGPCKPALGKS